MAAHYTQQETEHKKLKEKAFKLWNDCGADYRTLIEQYEYSYKKRREYGLKLEPVTQGKLRHFPEIPLLRVEDEAEAIEFIDELNVFELARTVANIENLKWHYVYRELTCHIQNTEDRIKLRMAPKTPLADSPDSRRKKTRGSRGVKED